MGDKNISSIASVQKRSEFVASDDEEKNKGKRVMESRHVDGYFWEVIIQIFFESKKTHIGALLQTSSPQQQ